MRQTNNLAGCMQFVTSWLDVVVEELSCRQGTVCASRYQLLVPFSTAKSNWRRNLFERKADIIRAASQEITLVLDCLFPLPRVAFWWRVKTPED